MALALNGSLGPSCLSILPSRHEQIAPPHPLPCFCLAASKTWTESSETISQNKSSLLYIAHVRCFNHSAKMLTNTEEQSKEPNTLYTSTRYLQFKNYPFPLIKTEKQHLHKNARNSQLGHFQLGIYIFLTCFKFLRYHLVSYQSLKSKESTSSPVIESSVFCFNQYIWALGR